MTSLIIDSEQRKPLQSFTPPASQPDTALGKSRDTAIYIPSDVESDTEDEDDASQELDGSPPFTALTSTVDYLDLTVTEYGATESEATISANIASAVSPTQVDAALGWPNEPSESHLADAGLSQQSCGMNHLLVGNTSTECQDINFATPPTSPESQPYPVAVDGKQLRPEPASQESNMVLDAVSDYDVCHSSQRHQDSPSTGAHSPRTASPIKVVQASFQENEIPVCKSYDGAIPKARAPSPATSSDEPCQGQASDNTSSASTHVESEATKVVFSSDAEVSSTSPSLRRFRHKSSQMHKTMQFEDGDADSEDSGNEDGLHRLESQHNEENSSYFPDVEDSGSEDDDLDDVHEGCKRRKISKSTSCSVRSTAANFRGSRKRQSTTRTAQIPSDIRTPEATPAPSEASMFLAQFEEWSLKDVLLKRITEGGKTTFQLQFEWDHDSCQRNAGKSISHIRNRRRLPETLHSPAKSSGGRWTPDEDNTVLRMKQEGKSWVDIQRALPHRSVGTIQVRYSTKLRG
ncbi:uncharacterized protein FMAN_16008 [Fusarium mangiferae]|uniref:Myb-like domain-containing protein n=1 Tax=Fusarium mangiferae TaxID=192010 RepID=A0A1L7SNP5_FUSMA|nr:uncharacterized protein FMAN_05092 [Fusarium mangiferae]XP_041691648.1 uncharacterized protein FMAN_16008 [Fusarium mangiferae]CVK88180.1 uncharacterized protein FMAN_05092 [Fusarium mangiferae]CVL09408.1 uncharacterized protein FMAN_16008 [Fusarium mangiferae]